MAKTDMRWKRTERHLMTAFEESLRERPIDKMSVTALSAAADINKATFYLHYHDIYDLAEAYARAFAVRAVEQMDYLETFFEDPTIFAKRFVDDFGSRCEEMDSLLGRNGLLPLFMDGLVETMRERLGTAGPADDGAHEDIVLTFILSGLLGVIPRFVDSDREELSRVCGYLLSGIGEYGKNRLMMVEEGPSRGGEHK